MTHIYAGIQIKNSRPEFNWNKDDKKNDVLYLAKPSYGIELIADIPVIYGYEYAKKRAFDEQKIIRDFIKSNADTSLDVFKFVETGIIHLNNMLPLDTIGYAVHPNSRSGKSLIDLMGDLLIDYSDAIISDFELVKETYQNVTFDADKASEALRKRGLPERTIQDRINKTLKEFEEKKKTIEPFEIKLFTPRAIRSGFMNFLKFGSKDEELVYKSLQGVRVLIYDDVSTSGNTLHEMNRYLTAINPNNELHSFVLLKQ